MKTKVIAIDGTAASGKGTLSKMLARHFGFKHLDTGRLYRAVGYIVLKSGWDASNEMDALKALSKINEIDLNSDLLNSSEVSKSASSVAKHELVRNGLIDYQCNFGLGQFGIVVDGRDIGSVIFPNADYKFFVTARPEIRAKRRLADYANTGISFDEVLSDINARDISDTTRSVSPLIQMPDSYLVNTSDISPAEMLKISLYYIYSKKLM